MERNTLSMGLEIKNQTFSKNLILIKGNKEKEKSWKKK